MVVVTGTVGAVYEIQSSVDLQRWDSLGVITNLTGSVTFVDVSEIAWPRRFYRAVLP